MNSPDNKNLMRNTGIVDLGWKFPVGLLSRPGRIGRCVILSGYGIDYSKSLMPLRLKARFETLSPYMGECAHRAFGSARLRLPIKRCGGSFENDRVARRSLGRGLVERCRGAVRYRTADQRTDGRRAQGGASGGIARTASATLSLTISIAQAYHATRRKSCGSRGSRRRPPSFP
jgi:hypothetical protein